MSFHIEHEGRAFSWHYNGLYGVGCFRRKSDAALSNFETGSDCNDVRRSLNRLKSKAASPRYPASAPDFKTVLDFIASEYDFS